MSISLPRTPTQLFIDGEFVDASEGRTIESLAPSTGELVARLADATEADVDRAVAAARRAFDTGSWSGLAPGERKAVLFAFAQLIEDHAEEIARLDAVEAGKPISDNIEGDLPDIVNTLKWYGEAVDKVFGKVSPTGEGNLGMIVREPVGVVGAIVPWNFPVAVLMMKLAPALATGNSVVVKPPEQASLSALRIAELSLEAGVPPGVLNVITGRGEVAGRALALHQDVDVLTFTGSTQVGRLLLKYAAESNLKKVVLELGGKSPQIVTRSVSGELRAVAEDLADAAFWNGGQNCTAGSRILVDNAIKDEFVAHLADVARARKVGDPLDPETQIGPLIEPSAFDRVVRYLDEAKKSGAKVLVGGEQLHAESGGLYLSPAVVDGASHSDPIAQDEIFGPVVSVHGFDAEEEAVLLANDTAYGLAATVWSRDIDQAIRLARKVKAGVVAVNGYSEGDITTPFGGFGLSGFGGKDKGLEALDQYTQVKTIWVTLT